MLEADVIGVVHDVSNTWTRDRLESKVLRLLYLYPRKHSFLILNKVCLYHGLLTIFHIIYSYSYINHEHVRFF
jgi:hypothetical protein